MKDIKIVSKYGYKFIAVTAVLLALSLLFQIWICFFVAIFFITCFLYRNPEREVANLDQNTILAPVDGRIIGVEKYIQGGKESTKIVISKGILDVGVLRSITKTEIIDADRTHGLFLCSYMKQSNVLNEKLSLACKNSNFDFVITITAGALARKIHFANFKQIAAGRRMGFIIDGNVTLILPRQTRVNVGIKDKVKAGDIIAYVEHQL